eukprot:7058004-Lingulodinium_polyedra.AAC.1
MDSKRTINSPRDGPGWGLPHSEHQGPGRARPRPSEGGAKRPGALTPLRRPAMGTPRHRAPHGS